MASETDHNGAAAAAPPLHRGTNQAGMRAQNERLVLSLVRRGGPLAKSEIAALTGLSAQTVSVIMRKLEADRLLRRGEPQRGRVGQPSVPLALDPDGAFFLGAKIGRRSLDLVVIDFAGDVRWTATQNYPYPTPQDALARLLAGVRTAHAAIGAGASRIAGLGVAMPFALWSWAEEIGAPPDAMAAWRGADLRGDLAARLPYQVYLSNDATAACGAELAFGAGADLRDFLYVHVGAFIGGGLVLDGRLVEGRTGNAAALGSMPAPDGHGRPAQLIDIASLVVLERRLEAAGRRGEALYDHGRDWTAFEPHLGRWIEEAARAIAFGIVATSAVIDIEAAVIDGGFPPDVRDRLIASVGVAMGALDMSGLEPPALRPGTLGPLARAIGGASLPLFDRYLVDRRTEVGGRSAPPVGA